MAGERGGAGARAGSRAGGACGLNWLFGAFAGGAGRGGAGSRAGSRSELRDLLLSMRSKVPAGDADVQAETAAPSIASEALSLRAF